MIRVCRKKRAAGNQGEIETTSAAYDMIYLGQPGGKGLFTARFSSPFVKPDAIDDK